MRAEVLSLQADNLKLYEKVRYMQSYRENTTNSTLDPLPVASSSSSVGGLGGVGGGGGGGGAAEMSKYHARYEEAMNPFEAFRGRVRLFPTHPHVLPI